MELAMSERRAVTKVIATRCARPDRAVKKQSLGALCATEADRAKLEPRGRSHTKPGTLLKDSIPVRTWAERNDAVPGFVEIGLVGHQGCNNQGEFCYTLDIPDIPTSWTENSLGQNKAQEWVFAAIQDTTAAFPFPILGIDSDNGSEFIN
ncbi:hypothetical protein [Arthrobacter globiformis]|nr:hypothetical protein [Arthrobacter globiformis]